MHHHSQPRSVGGGGAGSGIIGSGPCPGPVSSLPPSQMTTNVLRDPISSMSMSGRPIYHNYNRTQLEIEKLYRNSLIAGSNSLKVPSAWPARHLQGPGPPPPQQPSASVPVPSSCHESVLQIQPLMSHLPPRRQPHTYPHLSQPARSVVSQSQPQTGAIVYSGSGMSKPGQNLFLTPCQPSQQLRAVETSCYLDVAGTGSGSGSTHSQSIVNNNNNIMLNFDCVQKVKGQSQNFSARQHPTGMIKDVWKGNLEEEFKNIRNLLPNFKYVAMDTEFPGVVIRNAPYGRDVENHGNQLETIRRNVDVLKLIQLGISFFAENGSTPPGTSTWQFNFKFNRKLDLSAQSSIDFLHDAGVQFERHEEDGIDPFDFCYQLFSSGLILQGDVSWLTYHGGYDFGYLMRMLRGQNLPVDPDEFSELMKIYFPNRYDIKVILADYPGFVGGLHDVSVKLGLQRIGVPHQAGSDSLLTGKVFFRIKEVLFNNPMDTDKLENYNGLIFGLGKVALGTEDFQVFMNHDQGEDIDPYSNVNAIIANECEVTGMDFQDSAGPYYNSYYHNNNNFNYGNNQLGASTFTLVASDNSLDTPALN